MTLQLPENGFLILDKPSGISSAKAVAQAKHLLGCRKIGHGGTLDPLASGVLPLAIGEATKAFDYVASSVKEYYFTITFGVERSTDDAEGEVTASTAFIPSQGDIEHVLPAFTGPILQTPPVYSALKVDGKRAYKRAREGENVTLPPRPVEIHALALLATDSLQCATFSAICGKGTYIRSLARDIARKCGSLGYVSRLRRVSVGKFHAQDAISLDNLKEYVHSATLPKWWVQIEHALDDILAVNLDSLQAASLTCGRKVEIIKADGEYAAFFKGILIAFARIENNMLQARRVFNSVKDFN